MKMTKVRLGVLTVLTAVSALAEIEVRLVGADGEPVPAGAFRVEVGRDTSVDGIETATCKVRSETEGAQRLRLVGRVTLDGGATKVFDGHDERPLAGTVSRPFFKDDAFMMGAAWGGASKATAFALGADGPDPSADFTATASALEISAQVAFEKKGTECGVVFHTFEFAEIYGIRDAFARYYPLYPRRFLRGPQADSAEICDGALSDDDAKGFPLYRRFLAGERDLAVKEAFPPDALTHAAACRAVHRSFFTGAALPANAELSEWATLASQALVRMNKAGWKPVTGAVAVDADVDVARYGLGTEVWLAVSNRRPERRQVSAGLFSGELFSGRAGRSRDGGFLLVPFYGGVATNVFAATETRVTCTVGPSLANALEAVAGVRGTGTLTARWSGTVGEPALRVESIDFRGDVFFNSSADGYLLADAPKHRLKNGDSVSVRYRDAWMTDVAATLRTARHLGETDIVCSADGAAGEQAARIVRFFGIVSATAKRKLAPKTTVDKSLAPCTVKAAGVAITAADASELKCRTDRFLDALRWIRYPQYHESVRMPSADRALYRPYRP